MTHNFTLQMTKDMGEGLTEEEWMNNLYCQIRQGNHIETDEEHFPMVRKWLYQLACWLTDHKQGVYITVALNELMRLERKFGVIKQWRGKDTAITN